jgi:hypothetical protein
MLQVGSAVYRRNGDAEVISGETSRRWIVGAPWRQNKISKAAMRDKGNDGEYHPVFFASKEMAADFLFVDKNLWKISSAVQGVRDPTILRKVAELIGFKEA